ncbi:hypothetical protein P7C70_g8032, partial [Phenoliferia sp. Uapishka_3]
GGGGGGAAGEGGGAGGDPAGGGNAQGGLPGAQAAPPEGVPPPPGPDDLPPPDDIGPPPDYEPAIVDLNAASLFALDFYKNWRKNRLTEQAWRDFQAMFANHHIELPSLFKAKGLVTTITGHVGQRIPRCPTGCISYGCARYEHLEQCPRCGVPRRRPAPPPPIIPGGPPLPPPPVDHGESTWLYTGFIEALQAPFSDPANARRLRYRHRMSTRVDAARQRARHPAHPNDNEHIGADAEYDTLNDHTSGRTYESLRTSGFFQGERDGMLAFSWDGAELVRDKISGCWFVFVVNWSLPPEERHLKRWLICAAVIPGTPWDIESFLEPFHLDRIRLERGVWTWDASTRRWFIYRAFFVALMADLPARAKAASTVGHTGACGCMKCKVHGVTSEVGGGTYFPAFITPAGYLRDQYGYDDDPNAEQDRPFPELRTNNNYLADLADVLDADAGLPYEQARLRTGQYS